MGYVNRHRNKIKEVNSTSNGMAGVQVWRLQLQADLHKTKSRFYFMLEVASRDVHKCIFSCFNHKARDNIAKKELHFHCTWSQLFQAICHPVDPSSAVWIQLSQLGIFMVIQWMPQAHLRQKKLMFNRKRSVVFVAPLFQALNPFLTDEPKRNIVCLLVLVLTNNKK